MTGYRQTSLAECVLLVVGETSLTVETDTGRTIATHDFTGQPAAHFFVDAWAKDWAAVLTGMGADWKRSSVEVA